MLGPLAYRPRPGPLGAASPRAALVYLGPLAVATFVVSNPIVLVAVGLAVLVIGRLSDALDAIRGPLRFGIWLALSFIVINGLVSQRGETILVRLGELPITGQLNVSLEALAEGGVLALRVLVALALFAVWSACVNPDRILRGLRPIAGRSALTATLIARLVPLAAADGVRLAAAAKLRGPAAAEVGRPALARRLVAGSLDRSVDAAATLELRGYGLQGPATRHRDPRSPGELSLYASGFAQILVLAGMVLAGGGGFEAYPTISVDVSAATLGAAVLVPLTAAAPFVSRTRRRPATAATAGGAGSAGADR